MDPNPAPIFTAVSSSARHLIQLLRSINFSPTAEVQISSVGLRFSVDDSRAVQGLTILEKSLFSSYSFNANPGGSPSSEEMSYIAPFEINLSALLEVLQIFGLSDVTSRNANGGIASYNHTAFNTPALAITGGTCRFSYPHVGAPLSITISEAGVTTTCDLNTYRPARPDLSFDLDDLIPFERDPLTLKLIMRSVWLHDAISELASTNSTSLVLDASSSKSPPFALKGTGGPFGNSTVEFQTEPMPNHTSRRNRASSTSRRGDTNAPQVAEIFNVAPTGEGGRIRQSYRFAHVQKAVRAMALASKVSVRVDRQGVLSLQFMIELDKMDDGGGRNASGGHTASARAAASSGRTSFVDFRFVPLVDDDEEDEDDSDDDQPEAGLGESDEDF